MKERKKIRERKGACVQNELEFPNGHGGARKGAGRKKSPDSGVSHLKREEFKERFPVHVTMKILEGLRSLRIGKNYRVLLDAFQAAQKESFRIVHFSVQTDHVHMLVEAAGREALSRGMTGLMVRISRGLNRLWGREGSVFADRFHSRVLRTPTEVRNVLKYVFSNRLKHTGEIPVDIFDSRSSAMLFDGWREMEAMELVGECRPVVPARSWLVREGWRRGGGLLSLYDKPGSKPKKRIST